MLLRVPAAFFSLLSLKYLYISFFRSLPACCRVPLLHSPGARPSVSLSPPSLPAFPPLVLRSSCLPCVPWLPCRLSSLHRARLEALRRPSVCRAVCPLVAAVTRPPSGAKRCDSVGRCTAYMSPALSPLAYVLPWLVPWLPCACPAAVCRLVVVIGGTPLYPGRRRCGAASVM